MKYYTAITDGDNKPEPFIAEVPGECWKLSDILTDGCYIEEWPENIDLTSCQEGSFETKLANDQDWLIFSDEAIQIFKKNKIKGLQYLPITIYHRNEIALERYKHVTNITDSINCLDMEKSKYKLRGNDFPIPNKRGEIAWIEHVVLRRALLGDLDVFRIANFEPEIIVTEKFVKLYKDNAFSGMSFERVNLSN